MRLYAHTLFIFALLCLPSYSDAQGNAGSDASVQVMDFVVRNGDIIKNIALRANVSTQEILKLNKLHSGNYVAYPGLRLLIPVHVQPRTWDPTREDMSGNLPSREDRKDTDDEEIVIDSTDYSLEEDFVSVKELRGDSIEYKNIGNHITRIEKGIKYLNYKIDSLKQADFKLEYTENDKNSVMEKMRLTRDRYYISGPLGKKIDSLTAEKENLGMRRNVLRNKITEYEYLSDNASYSQKHFVHDEDRKAVSWGEHLAYDARYQHKSPSAVAVVHPADTIKRVAVYVDTTEKTIAMATATSVTKVAAQPATTSNSIVHHQDTTGNVTAKNNNAAKVIPSAKVTVNKPQPAVSKPITADNNIRSTNSDAAKKITASKSAPSAKTNLPTPKPVVIHIPDTTGYEEYADTTQSLANPPHFKTDFAKLPPVKLGQLKLMGGAIIALYLGKRPVTKPIVSAGNPGKDTTTTGYDQLQDKMPAATQTAPPAKKFVPDPVPNVSAGTTLVKKSPYDPPAKSTPIATPKPVTQEPILTYKPDTTAGKDIAEIKKEALASDNRKLPKYMIPVDSISAIKADFNLIRARQSLEKGDFKTGDKYLKKSLDLNPNDANTWMLHADLYLAIGMTDEALKEYIISGEIDSTNPKVFYNVALIYVKSNNNPQAYKYFTKAIAANQKYLMAYMGRATLLMHMQKYAEAISDYDHIMAINKYYTPALKERGIAKIELKKFVDAVADFNKYLEIEEPDGSVIYQRGLAKIYGNNLLQGCLDLSSANDLGYKDAEKAIKKFCQ